MLNLFSYGEEDEDEYGLRFCVQCSEKSIKEQKDQTPVVIETRFASAEQKSSLNIVKVREFTGRKKKDVFRGFSFEDIVKNNIQPIRVETSVNQTTRLEYHISGKGLFVIYDPAKKTAIPFRIVE